MPVGAGKLGIVGDTLRETGATLDPPTARVELAAGVGLWVIVRTTVCVSVEEYDLLVALGGLDEGG